MPRTLDRQCKVSRCLRHNAVRNRGSGNEMSPPRRNDEEAVTEPVDGLVSLPRVIQWLRSREFGSASQCQPCSMISWVSRCAPQLSAPDLKSRTLTLCSTPRGCCSLKVRRGVL